MRSESAKTAADIDGLRKGSGKLREKASLHDEAIIKVAWGLGIGRWGEGSSPGSRVHWHDGAAGPRVLRSGHSPSARYGICMYCNEKGDRLGARAAASCGRRPRYMTRPSSR